MSDMRHTSKVKGQDCDHDQLLEYLLKEEGISDPQTEPIPRLAARQRLPLSFSQERLWIIEQLAPGSSAYNLPGAFRLRGALDVAALENSLDEIFRRHEALRTVFQTFDGRPAQVISDYRPLSLPVVHLDEASAVTREQALLRIVNEEARKPFDLAAGPLFKVMLIALGAQEHVLFFNLHHIVADGWSVGVLVRELAALYESFSAGKPSPLAELEIQCADFAVWQRQRSQAESFKRDLDYWKRQLAGDLPVVELPTVCNRTASGSFQGGSQTLLLSERLSERLKALSRQEGVTMFMTLLAAFKALLYRYTGQRDILIGTPVANRSRKEVEGLIGFFLNTLVLRTDLGGGLTFRQALARVRAVALDAFAHQEVPFERLVEELQPARDLNRPPLFQVMFNMLTFDHQQIILSGLEVEQIELPDDQPKLDLTLYGLEEGERIRLSMVFRKDLFEPSTVAQMMGHLEALLRAIAEDPGQPIATLPLPCEPRRRQRAARIRQPRPTNPFVEFIPDEVEQSIWSRFERKADQHPDKLAVHSKSHRLTYVELKRMAGQWAELILARMGGESERIALLFDQGAPMIAAIMGVLKSGKTYVPLDPHYPTARLSYILEDSQASAVLTDDLALAQAFGLAAGGLPIINIDDPRVAGPFGSMAAMASPDSLAYILYTSGSTGQPKGVMQNHRNILRHIRNYTNRLHINAGDRLTLLSSYGFDAAVMDIFGALLNGATLYVADIAREGLDALIDLMAEQEITIYHSTPTVYRYLTRSLSGAERFPKLRLIVLGGEETLPNDVDLYREHFAAHAILVNGLGPTESTLALQFFIDRETRIGRNSVSVGYPVDATEVWLLNEAGEQPAVYGLGEIAIRSKQTALGYWNRPNLTEAVFFSDPSGGGKRTYLTGDIGRWLPDGSIEYVARKDSQVKIRGFRVELGEVESALCAHPSIRQAIALVVPDANGEKGLRAYVVPTKRPVPTTPELRAWLRTKLPEYLIPSSLIFLDELPVSPNGKADLQALLEAGADQQKNEPERQTVHPSPLTPVEEMVAGIFSEVLHLEHVDIHSNFFDLGGHSLRATQVISRVRKVFHVDLPLRSLFEQPTVAGLCNIVEGLRSRQSGTARSGGISAVEDSTATTRKADRLCAELRAPLVAQPRRQPGQAESFPLSYAQQRLFFIEQLRPGTSLYHIPAAARLIGPLNVAALESSLNEVARRHESLRTSFRIEGGEAVQAVAPAIPVTLPVVDLSRLPASQREAEALRLARAEARRAFNLLQPPLFRARLVRLSDEDHILLFTLHHLIGDGWSTGILNGEVAAFYEASARGEAARLAELPIQYGDFSCWQRQWLSGELLDVELRYWRQQLAGAPALLSLPTDRPRPAVQTFRGARQSLSLSCELTRSLAAVSRQQGTTMFMSLLAAFKSLLYRYTGQQDIVVATVIANRTRPEVEPLIGLFANTLVLRTDLSGEPTFKELLGRVREVTLAAYAHQDLPFEKLVEQLQPDRHLSHAPLFQVMFVLQNTPASEMRMSNLKLIPLEVETGTAKFDLTVTVIEGEPSLSVSLEYNADLFDHSTIARLASHYRTLLESIAGDGDRQIARLPLLREDEQRQLLAAGRSTGTSFPATRCIHELFQDQAERTPHAIAATFEQQQLSYGDLNRRANRLARYLKKRGIGPDVFVGIYLERSFELLVSILAVMKAGGAYVPLDSESPKDRLGYVMKDTGAPVLLTQKRLLDGFAMGGAVAVCLDADGPAILQEDLNDFEAGVTPEQAAYVIYTSGSTGQPKGVVVTHANVARLFAATREWFEFNGRDVWTLFHSQAFDFSVWEIFGALLFGGRLVVVPHWVSRSPAPFYDLVSGERVTVLNQTPSAFRQFMRAWQAAPAKPDLSLRRIIFGGEALEPGSLRPWVARHGNRLPELINMYGITETTVHVTYRRLTMQDITDARGSIVGKPIPDLQVYIFDDQLQLAPLGVAGEVYVAGAGLARGYLQRADLTAARFIPDPYTEKPGGRLYATGDVGRWLSSGEIEYMGRKDHQVKIRGFRIELGEIESVLGAHRAVRDAVVLAREDEPGDRRLVAYVTLRAAAAPTVAELRDTLKEKLPGYMLPSAFVVMQELPLTPTGKVDRRALPKPDQSRPALGSEFVAPIAEEEKTLAAIWGQVLGVDQVGIHDNFFALGGDSIRSLQVKSLAEQAGIDFSLEQLFRHQTVAELVAEVKVAPQDSQGNQRALPFTLLSEADRARLSEGMDDAYSLAMLQAGMLYHSQYGAESAVYHDVFSFYLRCPLNGEALRRAIQQVIDRHPVLRTRFDLASFSEPLQLVQTRVEAPLLIDDLRHLSFAEQERALDQWMEQEKKNPFELDRAPLLRFQVHRRSESTFQFTLSFHHAILDGWSTATMLTQLFTGYLSSLNSRIAADEAEPAASFRDYVVSERAIVASDQARQFWTEQLDNATLCALPRRPIQGEPDAPRAAMAEEVSLSAELGEALKRLANAAGVPLKSVLLAAHLRVLRLLGGQSDVLTGVVSNGRPEADGAERVLGLFLNTLPFRLKLGGGTWTDLVRESFELEHTLLPYRRFPLAELQKLRGGQPLFETVFNYVHFHVYEGVQKLEEIRLLGKKSHEETNIPLTANFGTDPLSGQLHLTLSYHSTALSRQQAEAIGRYYQATLAAMVDCPTARYESFSPLSPAERQQILSRWNDTRAAYPPEGCVHSMFEAQAGRTPDHVAVIFEQRSLSYRELDSRANRLAHQLKRLGIGSGGLAGIYMERSLEMIVAVLAALKAGAACLPLDPAYPQQRLALILEDARPGVVLTQSGLRATLPEHDAATVGVESDFAAIAGGHETDPRGDATPEHLAYVIYTSGSTGRPKGVCQTHRCLANLVEWHRSTCPESRRTLQFASLNFDVSFQEIFSTLSTGGTLLLVSEAVRLDAKALGEFIAENTVERFHLPNVILQKLAEAYADDAAALRSLREMMVGGEQLQITEPIMRLFLQLKDCRLHNHYGPSESHVISSFLLPADPCSWPLLPSIGRPIANSQMYILDSQLLPAPVGVAGELYLGGFGLARGYWERAALTAERFIPDSHSKEPGARLYQTGDLARYLPDGQIEFIGRNDYQVKIHGRRIELGEIEAVLGQCPEVQDAVAVVSQDPQGRKRIVAYLVADSEQAGEANLRRWLKDRLPDYMVPSTFVSLSELPRTPNGKVDRQALPPADRAASGHAADYVASRTAIEEVIAGVWSEVLGAERVSVAQDFFDAGGDSISATRVISRLRKIFQIELPLRVLFEMGTIRALAERIEAGMRAEPRPTCPPVDRASRNQPTPLSFAQERLWLIERLEAGNPAYNLSFALRLQGDLDTTALKKSFDHLMSRHEVFRTSFIMAEAQPVQIIQPACAFHLKKVDCTAMSEADQQAEVEHLASEEARLPFDLRQAPLFRAKRLCLSDEENVLLVSMHHIISDGWSMGILVRELGLLYNAYASGAAPVLDPLPIQYADYALWQRQWLQAERLEGQLSYWEGRLKGAPAVLRLPTDRPRPAVQTYEGKSQYLVLPGCLSRQLRKLSRQEGVTLFMTLLAAFEVMLYRYSGQEDLCVGTAIANRNLSEVEGLIGFFVNTLVLRADLSGAPTFSEVLSRVREVAFGAYAHQDLPFELLVERLNPHRNLSHTPLFQVMFAMQNAPVGDLHLQGLTAHPLAINSRTAKFDLTVTVGEAGEEIICGFEYNTALFDAPTVERMTEHYQRLIESAVAVPTAKIANLEMLTAAERNQLLVGWNETPTGYPRDRCIGQLFEEQAERAPERVALVFGGRQMTYAELNARANQLAHLLRRLGVSAESRIAICLHRSPELIISLLAIAKAGAAYVPLDPTTPGERLAFIAGDAGAALLLTHSQLAEALAAVGTKRLCIDLALPQMADESRANPVADVSPDNLAYLIYTSGTTGKPKGVAVTHRAVARLVKQTAYARLDAAETFLQLAPISFDASTFEVWGSLLNGARLVMMPAGALSLEEMAEALREQRVTTLWLTAGLFHQMVDHQLGALTHLRQMLAGGDVVSVAHAKKFLSEVNACTLVNGYGPTEGTTFTCCHVMRAGSELSCRVPIGRPIANTRVYVLDANLALLPVTVAGELYIAGEGLARGYWKAPGLTAGAFIPDPYSPVPGERMYRSGDLVKYRADGTIEFIARLDEQVKVRGFRVELSEVETVLSQHPDVHESAVIARETGAGDKQLIAYVATDQPSLSADQLRRFLKQKLPDYMVPSAFVALPQLPLTANGKVDKRALAHRPHTLWSARPYVAAQTPVEEMLVAMWQELMGLRRVGVEDDFFEVGGHSLLATQLTAKVRKAFDVEMPLRCVFDNPTIAGLAAIIDELLVEKVEQMTDEEAEQFLKRKV